MSVKHLAGAAAIAAGVGMSALNLGAGLAHADQPCNQPNCQPAPGGPTGPSQGVNPGNQQRAGNNGPAGTQPAGTNTAPGNNPAGNSPQGNNLPGNTPQGNNPPGNTPQGNNPPGNTPLGNNPQGVNPHNQPAQQQNGPGEFHNATPDQGGPRDTPRGFSTPEHGAPPAPARGDTGWNDGPPPGAPPRDWDGPAPAGGWDGPPPPGGWNRRWDGAPRDIDQARFDHQPFDWNDYRGVPIWDQDMGGWGFWFFGLWIPL